MKKFTIKAFALAAALFMAHGVSAQHDIVFEESFATGIGDFTLQGYTGSYAGNIWSWVDYDPMMKAEINNTLASYDKTPNPECLLQSPQVVLGEGSYVATFDQANVWMSVPEEEVQFVIREAGTDKWESLTGPLMKYDNWPLSSVGVIQIPDTYKNKTVEFAFRYVPMVEDFNNAGNWYVKNFVVWEGSTTDKLDAKLSFDEAEYVVNFDDGFMSPAANNPNDVEISYSSSNPGVADVDPYSGEVVLVGGGVTTITVTSTENDYFRVSSASYTLTVNKEITYNDVFTETFADGLGDFTVEGFNGANDDIWTDGGGFANADAYGKMDEAFTNYLVSPEFLLDGTSCIATFDYVARYFADDEVANQMMFSIREVGGGWENISIPVCQNTDNFISSGKIELPEAYSGKNIQVAFRYTAVNSMSAGNWQVMNLAIKAPAVPTGIDGVNADSAESKVYDLQGRQVKNPSNGVFIVNGRKVIFR